MATPFAALLSSVSADTNITYTEKSVSLSPNSATKQKTPKASKVTSLPEGAFNGERTVEKAKEYYESCTRDQLIKLLQSQSKEAVSVSRYSKADLIAEILLKITLPSWTKAELEAEATKLEIKTRGNKTQLATNIVSHLKAHNLIHSTRKIQPASTASAVPPAATSPVQAPQTPVQVSTGFTTSLRPAPPAEAQPPAIKEEFPSAKRPRKKARTLEDPAPQPTTVAPALGIDLPSMVEKIRSLGCVSVSLATDPTNLETERQLRYDALFFLDYLLRIGPNNIAFLQTQLSPHIQQEMAKLEAGWVEVQKKQLSKRRLERKRDKAKRRLESAQTDLASCEQKLSQA